MTKKKTNGAKEFYKAPCPSIDQILNIKKLTPKEAVVLFKKFQELVTTLPKSNAITIYAARLITELVEDPTILAPYIDDEITYTKVVVDVYEAIVDIYLYFRIEYICGDMNNKLRGPSVEQPDIFSMIDEAMGLPVVSTPKTKSSYPRTNKELKTLEDTLKRHVIGQDEAIETLIRRAKLISVGFETRGSYFFIGRTGVGKCFGKDTKIKMFDGSYKDVQDIIIGDTLMGDDSTPREVLSLARGEDNLYEITPIKGDPFVVNSEHILCLRHCSTNEIVEVSVKDYLLKSKNFKHEYKQYRVPVEYSNTQELHTDPYFLGLWIGDGTMESTAITSNDFEVSSYLESYANSLDLKLSTYKYGSSCPGFSIVGDRGKGNILRQNLKSLGCLGAEKKFIPLDFLRNTRVNRLKLLAGLMDSDGSKVNNCYEFITKYESLAEQVVELALSLGFYSSYKKCTKSCQTGVSGTYYRLNISGNTSDIPCKIERKICSPRKQIKDVTNTGFSVRSLGVGNYYGFVISGNKRFLLKDFTVTHNTELAKQFGERFYGNFAKINCSEYANGHEVSKLIGAPPGYVGSNAKSFFAEKAEKGSRWVFLFDEIEKGHEKLYNLLLSLLDDGTITDSQGVILDFSKSIFLFTSNQGLTELKDNNLAFGKSGRTNTSDSETLKSSLDKLFSPEFRGRIDEFIYFNDLSRDNAKKIAKLNLRDYPIVVTEQVLDFIIDNCYSNAYGVRDLKRFVKNNIALPVAEAILASPVPQEKGAKFNLTVANNKIVVGKLDKEWAPN